MSITHNIIADPSTGRFDSRNPLGRFIPLPAKIEGLTFVSRTTTSLAFSWTADANATGYNVYVNSEPTPRMTGATGTQTTLSGLSTDSSFNIRVSGVNTAGEGPKSDPVTMTTSAVVDEENGWFVSTAGSDSNAGTLASPFLTIQRAFEAVQPGDTIYIRAGTYLVSGRIFVPVSGTEANPITMQGYPGEDKPLFVFNSGQTCQLDTPRDGFRLVSINHWRFKGFAVTNACYMGFLIENSNSNIFENLTLYANNSSGMQFYRTCNNNKVINCDSFNNADLRTDGNGGDGFSAKYGSGTGNEYIGCRAWHCSDDGWDFFSWTGGIKLTNCWAFWCGIDVWGIGSAFRGAGNGFKLGGNLRPAPHVLVNCITFGMKEARAGLGFRQNTNTAGMYFYHCLGWDCKRNWNLGPKQGDAVHTVINSVNHDGDIREWEPGTILINNTWDLGITLTSSDFESLTQTLATAERLADGSLPRVALLRPVASSPLVDQGIAISGLDRDFLGAAPDIGPFEFGD